MFQRNTPCRKRHCCFRFLPPRTLISKFSLRLSRIIPSLLKRLVGTSGLEPPTSRLSGVRSNHLSYAPMFLGLFTCYPHNPFPGSCGGDEEDRTPDPLRARQMLSQLSYTPKSLLRESLSEPSKLNNILLRPSTPRIQESTLLSPAAFSP